MRGFTKTAKILLAVLLVIALAACGLLANALIKGQDSALFIIAALGAVVIFIMTFRKACQERDNLLKEAEEGSADVDDEEDEEISDY